MDLSKHLEKAEDAIRRKNFDFGINLYRQLLAVSPGDYHARLGLHRAYLKKHEAKPVPGWVAKVQGGPSLALAKTLHAAKQYAKEADSLESYVALDPRNVDASLALGEALERARLPDAALAVYEALTEAAPDSVDGWKRAGAQLTRKRELNRALECFSKALEIDPRDQEAMKARKNLAAEGALVTSGLETGAHSREIMKNEAQAKELERGQRLFHTADEIDAEIARLSAEAEKAPENRALLVEVAKLLERKNAPESALEWIERALALAPEDFDLKTRRGALRARVLEREVERLRAEAASDPSAAERLKAAEGEKLAFEVDEARRRVAEHPTDLSLRAALGRLLLKQGELDGAIGELQRAVTDPRVKLEALVSLGQAFFRKGLYDLARKQLERALEAVPGGSPRSKEILYNLGVISEKTGAVADALGFYLRIYEVDIGYRDIADKVRKLQEAKP